MSKKLFIGGLPWAMTNERLGEVFAEFGDVVEARVILDRDTGRSRGFGFVTYTSPESATKALELDGREVDGRPLKVDRAQEKERPARPPRDGDRPPRDGGRPPRDGGRPPRDGDRAPRDARPDDARGGERRREQGDWGGPERDQGERKKGRGRRRGGRGARGGGSSGFDDVD